VVLFGFTAGAFEPRPHAGLVGATPMLLTPPLPPPAYLPPTPLVPERTLVVWLLLLLLMALALLLVARPLPVLLPRANPLRG
jgi:hypothetical protein